MSRRFYDTYHASDDEITALKENLDAAGIDYFETHKGNWGIGSAGLWVKNDADFAAAREVVEEFTPKWIAHVRQQHTNTGINWARLPALIFVIATVIILTFYFYP